MGCLSKVDDGVIGRWGSFLTCIGLRNVSNESILYRMCCNALSHAVDIHAVDIHAVPSYVAMRQS